MAKSEHFDDILTLGQKIVAELDSDDRGDTLSRWMAHYIAELIEVAKVATEDQRHSRQEECARAILNLWIHRSALPNGKRPFEDFEPIFRTLSSLDPDDNTPRYFRHSQWPDTVSITDSSVKKWMEIATSIDHTARALIRFCLSQASDSLTENSKEWLQISKLLRERDNDVQIVNIIIEDASSIKTKDPGEAEMQKIESLQSRLAEFAKVAKTFSAELRKRMKK